MQHFLIIVAKDSKVLTEVSYILDIEKMEQLIMWSKSEWLKCYEQKSTYAL